jgi:glyoxylase-like metal-dependent hydrolase (beta-lactamase superfamily II)
MTLPNSKLIGDIEVVPVSDGVLNVTLTNFIGIEHDECARLSGFPIQGPIPLPVNAFVVKFNGKVALVDAGCSTTMGPTLGKLPENLRAMGVMPDQIDYVLLTHIHPDHSNGLVDDNGQAYYPNAEVVVSGEDAAFFLDRDPATGDNEFRQRNMRASQRAFAPYRDRTRRIGGGEIFAGISAHPQPGHTLGHICRVLAMWRAKAGATRSRRKNRRQSACTSAASIRRRHSPSSSRADCSCMSCSRPSRAPPFEASPGDVAMLACRPAAAGS